MSFKSLIDAVNKAGPSPCEKFKCGARSKCAEEKLSCSAFDVYAETGKSVDPLFVYRPHGKKFVEKNIGYPTPSREQFMEQNTDRNKSDEVRNELINGVISSALETANDGLMGVWR